MIDLECRFTVGLVVALQRLAVACADIRMVFPGLFSKVGDFADVDIGRLAEFFGDLLQVVLDLAFLGTKLFEVFIEGLLLVAAQQQVFPGFFLRQVALTRLVDVRCGLDIVLEIRENRG